MTIQVNDIKLFQSQDNTDNDSGGGSRTANEVIDGQVNNLFPDISRIDTVSGDVALRKVFPVVFTENKDIYYGAHSMLSKVPDDPRVSSLLFYTGSPSDRRSDAQDAIESYVVASFKSDFYLYGNHIAGAKALTFLQREELSLPQVGEVYLLQEGTTEQYVRIIDIDYQVITLVYNNTEYQRRRIIATIDQALEFAFTGSTFNPSGQTSNTADTFDTQVADAAKYYGTKTLDQEALTGAQTIKVDSIYEQLVPATTKQTPIVNSQALGGATTIKGADEVDAKYFYSEGVVNPSPWVTSTFTFPMPIARNSLDLYTVDNSFSAANNLTDDGNGNVIKDGSEIVGTVDYIDGIVVTDNVSRANYGANKRGVVWRYKPAVVLDNNFAQFTGTIFITQENQSLVFVRNLSPLPSLTNLYVDYRANGKWYRLNANSDGTLGEDPNIGAGLLSDNGDGTGTVSLTLGALPDIDSSIIFSWGSAEMTQDKTGVVDDIKPQVKIDLGYQNIDPSTFSMSFRPKEGGTHTSTALDANNGFSIDSVQCRLDEVEGIVYVESYSDYDDMPNTGVNDSVQATFQQAQDIGVHYQRGLSDEISATIVTNTLTTNGTLVIDLNQTNVKESSIYVNLYMKYQDSGASFNVRVYWDKSKARLVASHSAIQDTNISFNSSTSELSIAFDQILVKRKTDGAVYLGGSSSYYTQFEYPEIRFIGNSNFYAAYRYGTLTPEATVINVSDRIENLATIEIHGEAGVTGEVAFRFVIGNLSSSLSYLFNDLCYYSKDGVVYRSHNSQTDTGTQAGTINYTDGVVEIDYFIRFDSTTFVDLYNQFSCVNWITNSFTGNELTVNYAAFKTATERLTTSSFQVRYDVIRLSDKVNIGSFTATSDQNGAVSGLYLDAASRVDTQTGMAELIVANNATYEILVSAIKYDAVGETTLPLDPELLGLNPVRLPSDGRVPLFESGRHLIIFHEASTAVNPAAGATVTLARQNQSYVQVVDVNGHRLDTDQFTFDKALGELTFANPLVLNDRYGNPLTAPYTVIDRIEDMVLASDVQINGLIGLSAATSHTFPVGSKVASALVWSDMGARVFNLFSQKTWNSSDPNWTDTIIGDPSIAQYDDINYPLQIVNKDSTTGKWAIVFQTATTVDVIEQDLGVLLQDVDITTTDIAPINVATGQPYFTMLKEGFGGGWVTSNVVRFDTESGEESAWLIRTVASGALSEVEDSIELEIRGDAN